jgi:hypothetical protein
VPATRGSAPYAGWTAVEKTSGASGDYTIGIDSYDEISYDLISNDRRGTQREADDHWSIR